MGVFISNAGDITMAIQINPFTKITLLDPGFVELLNNNIQESSFDTSDGVILNFNPIQDSMGHSLHHPMKFSIGPDGKIQYLTVYSKSASPPVAEADWNFIEGIFTHYGETKILETARAQFQFQCRHLVGLVKASQYEVTVAPLITQPKSTQTT